MNAATAVADSTRGWAEAAARRRLLNAYLRETGLAMDLTSTGLARIPLPAARATIVVALRHRSATGQHDYGERMWCERAGTQPTALGHDQLVALLLDEVRAVAGRWFPDAGDGARRQAALAAGVANSVEATARYLAYARPPRPADPRALTRHAEQSLVYGHPFHPTPKSSHGFGPELARYAPELGASFTLHWFAVHPSLLAERRVAAGPWVPEPVTEHARTLLGAGRQDYRLLPAHPWQAAYLARQPRVAALLREGGLVALGPLGRPCYPTSSVRTVCDPAFPTAWKLPLHVQITNFVRTNPWPHLARAADASALVAELSPGWHHKGFGVLVESGFRTVDPHAVGHELAADFAVLFRDNPFTAGPVAPRVVASLLEERPHAAPDLVDEVRRAGPPSAAHVTEWLRRYLRISLLPLLDVFDTDGISFEAHVQNSLLHTEDGWPARFWVRDMEGTSASRKRLRRGIGYEDSPLLYDDEEAWLRLRYHAVTNHLGHLVHVLGRYCEVQESLLWRAVRELLTRTSCRPAHDLIDAPALPAKANLVSRFAGRAENPRYVDIPNPLFQDAR